MASEWIKIRTDIYRDPKVIRMASHLMSPDSELASYVNQNCQCDMTVTRNVTRNAVVGALVAVWGIARRQGKRDGDDLVMRDATFDALDDIAELQGIGSAMVDSGWVSQRGDDLVFPMFFKEYNSEIECDTKAKNAERQKRYRDAKRNVTNNVTVTSQSNTDKIREDKTIKETQDANASVVSVEKLEKQKHERIAFQKPARSEVMAYATEIGAQIDSGEFMDFYESNGWKVGRNPMKDWKATVRSWEARRKAAGNGKTNGNHVSEEFLKAYDVFRKHIGGDKIQLRKDMLGPIIYEAGKRTTSAEFIRADDSFSKRDVAAIFEKHLADVKREVNG